MTEPIKLLIAEDQIAIRRSLASLFRRQPDIELVAEVGDFSRFAKPRQLMAYLGLVPSEHSSGRSVRRAGITKAGNALARRALIETGLSLCTSFSSVWKHWKWVCGRGATRATFTGDRRSDGLRLQVA